MPDQEVHEIQLNGKQLVFMFGAATMVSVVIFLCGVMVGRGVRQVQPDVPAASSDSALDATAPFETTTSRSALPSDPPPAPAQERLTYAEHLEAPVVPDEPLKPAETKPPVAPAEAKPTAAPTVAPAVAEKAAPKVVPAQETKGADRQPPAAQKASAAKPEPSAEGASFAEPSGNGYVVQVMAFPARADADALARRLSAKGYRTFVALNDGAPRGRFRVRVGKYPTKGEADAVSRRLQQEERFEPWVTR